MKSDTMVYTKYC